MIISFSTVKPPVTPFSGSVNAKKESRSAETILSFATNTAAAAAMANLDSDIQPTMDPTDIASIHNAMDKTLLFNPAAKAAIDVACYDIIGKKAGLPVHKLLGANTVSLQTDITIGIDTIDEMVKECVERVGEGFRILKIKCGIDPKKDIEVLRQIRAAVGDKIDLRIDINQGYDIATALYVLNEIEKFNISEAEQPLPYWDVHGMAQIKKLSPIPIMADESVHTPEQARIVCEHDAAEILNIKFMKCGGIYKALQISDIASEFGKRSIPTKTGFR